MARFAGVRSRELRCRARRRQTSVRATRLRFYATLCLYPCLLTALSLSLLLFILFFLLLGDHHPSACSGLRRALTPSPFSSFSYFYFAYFHPKPLPHTDTKLSNFVLEDVFNNAGACSATTNTPGYPGNRMSRARNGDTISDGMLTIKI